MKEENKNERNREQLFIVEYIRSGVRKSNERKQKNNKRKMIKKYVTHT